MFYKKNFQNSIRFESSLKYDLQNIRNWTIKKSNQRKFMHFLQDLNSYGKLLTVCLKLRLGSLLTIQS
jgi:hypothetical protein